MFVKNFTEKQFVNGGFSFYIQQNYDEIKFLIFRQQKTNIFTNKKPTYFFNEYYFKKKLNAANERFLLSFSNKISRGFDLWLVFE